jgi:protein gp37
MGDKSKIEWTEATWNPIVGCSVVSPGCVNCYAMKMAARIEKMTPGSHYAGTTQPSRAGAVWTGKVALAPDRVLTAPLRWKRPRKIFVNSMGDLFHESVPDAWIDRVFAVMQRARRHTFQILTKQSARMRAYMSALYADADSENRRWFDRGSCWPLGNRDEMARSAVAPFPNVWLGVSAEDQARADERVPDLLATPAAVRFVSAEPLLGEIDFRNIKPVDRYEIDALTGYDFDQGTVGVRLDWIIVGGESGPHARPMHPGWSRSILAQCEAANGDFFKKQWGEWKPVSQMTEAEIDACYDPRPERHPDAARRPRVQTCVLHLDGTRFVEAAARGAYAAGSGAMAMFRVGKRRAGRRLDGVEHNGFPEPRT